MTPRKDPSARFRYIFGFIGIAFFGILIRLFYIQVISGEALRLQAISQYEQYKKIPAKRGDIVSSDGSPLAISIPSFLVFAEPEYIQDPVRFSIDVSHVLQIEDAEILKLVSDPNKKWVSISNKIDVEKKIELEKLHLAGLGFEQQSKRYYPEASMAAHLLGFVGFSQEGNQQGYFGVEGYYDRELSGKDGSQFVEKDARGLPILIGKNRQVAVQNGRTLVLWLDRSMQFIVEKRLKEALEAYGAKEGNIIVMDPKSGGILAMASFPNYDPSFYSEYENSQFVNPAVATSYEPGSTFKPVIMSAALNEGVITPETSMREVGPVRIGEYSIKTWDEKYHGDITMTQILQYSSNVGMVFVGNTLGKESLLKYIKDFGFGEKTNIDLQDEVSPQLRAASSWVGIDYATASFGQGIAVTPLQLVRAIAAIANGGVLMEPKVVKEIINSDGTAVRVKEKHIRRVLSKETTMKLTKMMVEAVSYGEAKWAKPKGYSVAGKTGTAQIPVSGHYDEEKTIASFVGFAPAQDPQFVMLVTLREPETSPWGSETAAPLFFKIAKDLFSYLGVAPSE